jgi:hypothetical protein
MKQKPKGVNKMDLTRSVLQEYFGDAEYRRLLNSANQISIFGEPVNKLSTEDLVAALTFVMQSKQEQVEQQHAKENNFRHLPANTRKAGLW